MLTDILSRHVDLLWQVSQLHTDHHLHSGIQRYAARLSQIDLVFALANTHDMQPTKQPTHDTHTCAHTPEKHNHKQASHTKAQGIVHAPMRCNTADAGPKKPDSDQRACCRVGTSTGSKPNTVLVCEDGLKKHRLEKGEMERGRERMRG